MGAARTTLVLRVLTTMTIYLHLEAKSANMVILLGQLGGVTICITRSCPMCIIIHYYPNHFLPFNRVGALRVLVTIYIYRLYEGLGTC